MFNQNHYIMKIDVRQQCMTLVDTDDTDSCGEDADVLLFLDINSDTVCHSTATQDLAGNRLRFHNQ